MKREDAKRVAELSNRYSKALIRNSNGRLDVLEDLITRVATETCRDYFGLQVDDPDAFAEWAMSISALLFADPFGNKATRRLALNGAARVRAAIDRSIATKKSLFGSASEETVLGRLLHRQSSDQALTDARICAILVGLVTGFIPTNTLAAGKIMEELLRRPEVMRKAMELATAAREFQDRHSDAGASNSAKNALEKILLEAARLNPALAPGQWRYARKQAVIGSGTSGERRLPQGSVLMVATMSALRDSAGGIANPGHFDPERDPSSVELMFGSGIHWCLGEHLARAQITEVFMVLLSQTAVRVAGDKWGRMRWVGPFPRRLEMEFQPVVSQRTQTMITVCAPLAEAGHKQIMEEQLNRLGNPANSRLTQILHQTNIIHFASLSLINAGNDQEPAYHLLLELNADGSQQAAIDTFATACHAALDPIFQHTAGGHLGLRSVLQNYALDVRPRPWGAIGLNYNGNPELSVPDIHMQASLAELARDALDLFMRDHVRFGNRAMQALNYVRDIINQNPMFLNAAHDKRYAALGPLLARGAELRDFLVIPSRKRLKLCEWRDRTKAEAIGSFLTSSDIVPFAIPVMVFALSLIGVIFFNMGWADWASAPGRILVAVVAGLAGTALILFLAVAIFLGILRFKESRDVPQDENPTLGNIENIRRAENHPGFEQNHFLAVTPLKSGWFRKLTLAMALWGIKQLIVHAFRPGFVLNMGTIHYAKWFRLPGRDKLVFLSNYDGSWESYLEDFIMKAHQGQTAAWSNGVGFPLTRFLILDGAQDGDRFKRWVRRQQVPAQFWYSRFPSLTSDQIRDNALIHDGLARAITDTAARNWLDCFGSMPRPDYAIETEEAQSLVFRGYKHFQYALFALIRLPEEQRHWSAWFERLSPGIGSRAYTGQNPDPCAITFGDHPFSLDPRLRKRAMFVGFTAAGLKRLGVPSDADQDGIASFPSTFNLGMANRGEILGDLDEAASSGWRWKDAARIDEEKEEHPLARVADAILLIYAESVEECDRALQDHANALGGMNAFLHLIQTTPSSHGLDHEHFGFRDGISQPVIKGTERFSKGVLSRDIVEPGEFILGYRNNQRYYPPTPVVRAESDRLAHLPSVITDAPSKFPSFGGNPAVRDFGRNGTFLVVRQLRQNVAGFEHFTQTKAQELRHNYGGLDEVVGAKINAQWIAAKLMGRWRDGTPLVRRPGSDKGDDDDFQPDEGSGNVESEDSCVKRSLRTKAAPFARLATGENDFAYGIDDPQGFHCPFGAHIRRANPRDSLQPEDPEQQAITNRHRLLRRGRTYEYQPPNESDVEKGLLFTCICADLDRQFEFVQQTWIASPSFHGLTEEPDPIVASKSGRFTIPTRAGPIRLQGIQNFVQVRGGGYFFLPSLSAIRYLADLQSIALKKLQSAAPVQHTCLGVAEEQKQ
jgi:Dyp-type peroxidase family